MRKTRTSISRASSLQEIADFWDRHDLADFWEKTRPAKFELHLDSEVIYYAVDKELSARLQKVAQKRGIAADTLLNLWMQEKLKAQKV